MTLWSLDRVSFRLIVLEANARKTAGLETIIEKAPLLTHPSRGPALAPSRSPQAARPKPLTLSRSP